MGRFDLRRSGSGAKAQVGIVAASATGIVATIATGLTAPITATRDSGSASITFAASGNRITASIASALAAGASLSAIAKAVQADGAGVLIPVTLTGAPTPTPTPTPTTATLFPSFADPGSSGAWADLSAAERAQRQAVATEMTANGWFVDPDTVTFDDTVTITGITQLESWLNGTAVSGVTRNVTRNQKLLLAGSFDYATLATNVRFRSLDYLANGKMLLIDGQGVNYTTKLTITGCRGLFFRNIQFDATQTIVGGDLTWSPGWITTTYTNGGAGFVVGQTLTVVTRPSAVYKDPVLQVAAVDGSGAITAVTVLDRGMMTGTAAMTFSSGTSTVNASLSGSFGTNPRDAQAITITRSSSFPLTPVVTFDQCNVGSGYRTSSPIEAMVGINIDNCEQIVVTRSNFYLVQTGVKCPGVRRLVFHENDFKQQIGDSRFVTNTRGNTAVTTGTKFIDLWPDGLCYRWDSRNTVRDVVDACDLTNSAGHDMGLDQEHSDCQQSGTSGDSGGYSQWSEFNANYLERATYKDRPIKSTRYYAGTQGIYLDDSPYTIQHGSYGDVAATLGGNTFTAWSGNVWYGRCTAVRVGVLAASGTNTNNSSPSIYSRKKYATGITSDHNVRKCVAGAIQTVSSGTVYEPGNLIQTSNTIIDPAVPGAYAANFPGSFITDGEGRTSYTFDEAVTRDTFRSALWSRFGKAGVGFLDPATWG